MSNISIQRTGGNILNSVGNEISAGLSTAGSVLQGILGSASTFVSNIWGGGFVGIKDFDELYNSVTTYAANVQAAVDEYNEVADISSTIKGQAAEGVSQFVVSTKELLRAYASLVKAWVTELEQVKSAYEKETGSIHTTVSEAATEVSNAAKNISLD